VSKSPEKKISIATMSWFRDNAGPYNFEPDIQFKGILSDDEFKYLDMDTLWKLVADDLQSLIEDYLLSYKDNLWNGSLALRDVSCQNDECVEFDKEEEEREVVLEKEYSTEIGKDIPDEVYESWTWTCPTCGIESEFQSHYDYDTWCLDEDDEEEAQGE